jgi:hypothetical protein
MLKKVLFRSLILLLVVSIAGGTGACKSKKKLAREKEAAEYAARLDNAKSTLTDIISGTTTMSLDEKEAAIQSIRNMNLNDPEIDELLSQAEAKVALERAKYNQAALESKQKEAEATAKTETAETALAGYFSSIAGAGSVSQANMTISETLKMFSSPDAPVFIVISKEGGIVDYDRPTTILNYLNYLKDTRNNINSVDKIVYDNSGKIKELELIKNN